MAKLHSHICKLPLLLNQLSDVSSFSSALKRMMNVSVPKYSGGRAFTSVKGAPETIKRLLASIPDGYDRYANVSQDTAAVSSLYGRKIWMQCQMIGLSILLANRWEAICDLPASSSFTAHSKRTPWRRSKVWLTHHIG